MTPQRLQYLIDLDIEAARQIVPTGPFGEPMSDEGLLVGMHKARLHCRDIPMKHRQQSLDWLRANGFKDMYGAPLPTEVPR